MKPFKYTYQKEIVMYAYFKKLDYFSTECIYAPFAARGLARDFVKDLEVNLSQPCIGQMSPHVGHWLVCFKGSCSARSSSLQIL